MKCFIKSYILGLEPKLGLKENSNRGDKEVCTVVNPIVRSLVTSAMFVVFVAVVSNMLHV